MLGKKMVYEISTCQMQYDTNSKETSKVSVILGSLAQMIYDEIHMWAIIALVKVNRVLGFLRRNLYACP